MSMHHPKQVLNSLIVFWTILPTLIQTK